MKLAMTLMVRDEADIIVPCSTTISPKAWIRSS